MDKYDFSEIIKRNKYKLVEKACKSNINVNQSLNDNHDTALYICCEYGHYELFKLLVNNGANINQTNIYLRTPLHRCAMSRSSEDVINIINFLIRKGADVNLLNINNMSAIDLAVINKNPEIVKILMNNGAKVTDIVDRKTPFMYAVDKGLVDILKILIPEKTIISTRKNNLINDTQYLTLTNKYVKKYYDNHFIDNTAIEYVVYNKFIDENTKVNILKFLIDERGFKLIYFKHINNYSNDKSTILYRDEVFTCRKYTSSILRKMLSYIYKNDLNNILELFKQNHTNFIYGYNDILFNENIEHIDNNLNINKNNNIKEEEIKVKDRKITDYRSDCRYFTNLTQAIYDDPLYYYKPTNELEKLLHWKLNDDGTISHFFI